MFNASISKAVAVGTCVILREGEITYAGPIKGAPTVDAGLVLFNAVDFEKLKAHVEKRKH